jgi:hypothetical protein
MHHCEIKECGATLNGLRYFAVTLDGDRKLAVCPNCMRKIRAARKEPGLA